MFAVYRFFVDYGPERETKKHVNPITGETVISRVKVPGKTREIHKVEYGPIGSDKTRVVAMVDHLRPKLEPGMEPVKGSAAEMAMIKWNVIEPLYEKWKRGQEITPDGTPLAAWSGVSKEQAEGLRKRDISTIEQLASLTDSHFERYQIQGLRQLRDHAQRFLASADSSAFQTAIEERDVQIAGLQDTIRDMGETMRQMQHTMANLQMAQQSTRAGLVPHGPIGSDEGGHSEQDVNNDDAFGGEDLVKVETPRRQARR